jgi:hypothetical protein
MRGAEQGVDYAFDVWLQQERLTTSHLVDILAERAGQLTEIRPPSPTSSSTAHR